MNFEKRVVILYGSQTGTAQEMAEGLWRQFRRFNFTGPVMSMDDYQIKNLIKEPFVIFICSVTGVGEEPDNMKNFWKFLLRKNLPPNSLSLMNYAVLGLGDTTYTKFNYPAKKLNNRLLQLGGNRLIDIGLCDYQHDLGHDSVAEPWIEKLWQSLKLFFPDVDFSTDNKILPSFIPRWKISKNIEANQDCDNMSLYQELQSDIGNDKPFIMKLKSNTRTTAESHFQDVRLLEFVPNDESFQDYGVGDVLYLRPKNSKEMVQRFFDIFGEHKLNLKPDDVINISEIYTDMPVPKIFSKPIKLIKIVEEYWDLSSIPKKYAFSILGNLSEDEMEKGKCIEFCSSEGQEDLYNYCNRPRRNIIEVLEDFVHSTSMLTLDGLFELFTCIKPRAFSIASSCKAYQNKQIDLLVAVVKYYTKLKKERLGLCSNWLKELEVGDKVLGWIKNGTFKFPDKNIPIVMVGPGTGLAPFRSLIMEKDHFNEASKDNLLLFFGCRNEKGDFHCSDYLNTMKNYGKLNLICAFSRDQDHKVYVQHKIEDNSKLLWQILNIYNGYIFVAGNSKDMPDSVKSSIKNVILKEGLMNKDDSENYFKQLEEKDRVQLETW